MRLHLLGAPALASLMAAPARAERPPARAGVGDHAPDPAAPGRRHPGTKTAIPFGREAAIRIAPLAP